MVEKSMTENSNPVRGGVVTSAVLSQSLNGVAEHFTDRMFTINDAELSAWVSLCANAEITVFELVEKFGCDLKEARNLTNAEMQRLQS